MILALAVACSLVLSFFVFFFFFYIVFWLTKESGGRWLWPVVVVVGLADVEVFVVFFW